MSVIQRIRRAIREGNYLFTGHAREEAEADGLRLRDIIDVLLSGELDSVYADDVRGPRYVVRGFVERVELDVVCRFRADGALLIIITVYVVD